MNQKISKILRKACIIDGKVHRPTYQKLKKWWKSVPWKERSRR